MPSSDQQIKWSNFSHTYCRTYHIGGKGWNGTGYMYISGAAFNVHLHVAGALLATAELYCRFDYYNWATNSWVTGSGLTASARGVNSSDDKYYYHNWNGNSTDNDSRHNVHFWRVYTHTVNTGNQRYVECDYTVGGLGCMSETQYNTICKGKKIVSAGRLGGDWLHWSDQSPDDSTALNYFRWSDDSGTNFDYTMADKLIPKSW